MVDHINRTRRSHIVTIEDPIEILHEDHLSIVNQREVGLDTESFGQALRRALRQDPDTILIGELRDAETAQTALQAAESGHLVLSTMHTIDAAETVGRMIEFFPEAKQQQIRSIMAGVLRGVVSQRLLPRTGGGRVAVVEVMVTNARIADLIREGRPDEITDAIAEGEFFGMQTFEQALIELVVAASSRREVAANAAPNRHDFLVALERELKRRGRGREAKPADADGDELELGRARQCPGARRFGAAPRPAPVAPGPLKAARDSADTATVNAAFAAVVFAPGARGRQLPQRRRRAVAARAGRSSAPLGLHALRRPRSGARDNVPLVSYLLLRGRCRSCRAPIGLRYPAVELGTALLVAACVLAFGPTLHALAAAVFCAALVADLGDRHRAPRRPEPGRAPGAAVVLALQLAWHPSLEWPLAGLGAALFLFLAALAYPRGMGMGDVKLALLLGVGVGRSVPVALLPGMLAALVPAVVLFARHGAAARKLEIPFAPFLALGGLVALFAGHAILHWYLAPSNTAPLKAIRPEPIPRSRDMNDSGTTDMPAETPQSSTTCGAPAPPELSARPRRRRAPPRARRARRRPARGHRSRPADRLAAARARAGRGSLAQALVDEGIASSEGVARALAERYHLPYVDILGEQRPARGGRAVPLQVLERAAALPYRSTATCSGSRSPTPPTSRRSTSCGSRRA